MSFKAHSQFGPLPIWAKISFALRAKYTFSQFDPLPICAETYGMLLCWNCKHVHMRYAAAVKARKATENNDNRNWRSQFIRLIFQLAN